MPVYLQKSVETYSGSKNHGSPSSLLSAYFISTEKNINAKARGLPYAWPHQLPRRNVRARYYINTAEPRRRLIVSCEFCVFYRCTTNNTIIETHTYIARVNEIITTKARRRCLHKSRGTPFILGL